MDKQKKMLLCMYVDDFCGIKEESFNFFVKRRYTIRKGKISRKNAEEIKDFPMNFWGMDDSDNNASKTNISAVTLLIGENGAGKTTLMRLLIKWLCQLSAGNIPQERGALVISVDDEDKLIAFDGGKPWTIENNKNEKIVCVEDKSEIKKLLGDIRLAYYTDTMTDLELSNTLTTPELEFLQDDSLLKRLSNAMQGRYSVDSVKDRIKGEDFKRQMDLLLFLYSEENPDVKSNQKNKPRNLWKFPIHCMKITAPKAGDEKSFGVISNGNSELIKEACDLWKNILADDTHNNDLRDITKALLWGLFSGTITSLLGWERTLTNLEERIVTEQVRLSLRAYIRYSFHNWNTLFKRFFKNLFIDCEKAFRAAHRYEEFSTEWNEQIKDNISSFLNTLKNIENGKFLDKWVPSENVQNVWEFELKYFNEKDESDQTNIDDEKKEHKSLLQKWRCFWENYQKIAKLMPECKFDWRYPSSGEANKANLYCTMRIVDIDKYSNTWFLLDEPDNTFHPEWKRKAILDILNICSNYDINIQLLLSTHSPIMLSDVPKQAAILLKSIKEKKVKYQVIPKSSPFGQQIYTLFKDSFFMEQGVIGAFAAEKISATYSKLVKLEKKLSGNRARKKSLNKYQKELNDREYIIDLIDEPLLSGHLSQSYKWCSQKIREKGITRE